MARNSVFTNKGVVRVDVLGAVVKPGILFAPPGGSLRLTNKTGGAIDVFLTGCAERTVLRIPGGEEGLLRLTAPEGIHPFAVFSHKTGDFARGNSSPRVIIK